MNANWDSTMMDNNMTGGVHMEGSNSSVDMEMNTNMNYNQD